MGVLKDVCEVLENDLFNMELHERMGYVDPKKQSVIKHIEELKSRLENGEDE